MGGERSRAVSRQILGLLFLVGVALPLMLYQAWLIRRWWRQEKARKRELEARLRCEMETTLHQALHEKIPESFRRAMMKEIPVEFGGSFESEGIDGTSQAQASEASTSGLPHVQTTEGRASRQAESEEPASECPTQAPGRGR